MVDFLCDGLGVKVDDYAPKINLTNIEKTKSQKIINDCLDDCDKIEVGADEVWGVSYVSDSAPNIKQSNLEAELPSWMRDRENVTLMVDNKYIQGSINWSGQGEWEFTSRDKFEDNQRIVVPLPDLPSTYKE